MPTFDLLATSAPGTKANWPEAADCFRSTSDSRRI